MPPEPLRFLHAASPRLDEPLRAPRLAQRQDLGELLRDATLIAFDGVIEAAIEHGSNPIWRVQFKGDQEFVAVTHLVCLTSRFRCRLQMPVRQFVAL